MLLKFNSPEFLVNWRYDFLSVGSEVYSNKKVPGVDNDAGSRGLPMMGLGAI